MTELLSEWNNLDVDHKKFILRVRDGNGGKHAAEPCSIVSDVRFDPPYDEYFTSIALWEKAEKSNFIECTGSYKWIATNKFKDLESELFGLTLPL